MPEKNEKFTGYEFLLLDKLWWHAYSLESGIWDAKKPSYDVVSKSLRKFREELNDLLNEVQGYAKS